MMTPSRMSNPWSGSLLWSLCLTASVLLYGFWPDIDLSVSAWFFDAEYGFGANRLDVVQMVHRIVPYVGWGLLALGLTGLVLLRGRARLAQRLSAASLAIMMLFGVALAVNGLFKSHWGRARPVEVSTFGGARTYTPPLAIAAECSRNCSFVSGHASTGFALMSLGAFGAKRRRQRWIAIGWIAGLTLGALRIAQGGHFLGDILFAGLLIWGLTLLTRPVLRSMLVARRPAPIEAQNAFRSSAFRRRSSPEAAGPS